MAESVIKKEFGPRTFVVPSGGTVTISFYGIYEGLLMARGYRQEAYYAAIISGYGPGAIRNRITEINNGSYMSVTAVENTGTATIQITNSSAVEMQCSFLLLYGIITAIS